MNILVTGATGFIGRRLTQRLREQGHRVSALTRDPSRAAKSNPYVDRFYPWRTESRPPHEAIETADAVINLAGETVNGRWSPAKKERIYNSRIDGTRNLVEELRMAKASKTLVSISAVGFYGDRGEEELTESSAQGEGFLAHVTEDWEAEALKAEAGGHRVVIMRLGIVLGPEGGAMQKMLPIFKVGGGGALGSGKQWWPWVHVDDVVSALITAATDSSWRGVFNLTAPEPVREREFATVLGSAVHRPAFMPVPAFMLRLIQGEFADEILFSKRVLPKRLEQAGFAFSYPDIQSAMNELVRREAKGAAVPTRA